MKKLDPDQLRKLSELDKLESAPPTLLSSADPQETVTAIVEVTEPDYVPEEVQVRARIAPTLFTAEFLGSLLPALDADPRVKSVALSRRQQMIE